MRIEPLGDRAFILRELPAPAFAIAKSLNHAPPPGVVEAVASYDTVGLYCTPEFDPRALKLSSDFPEEERRHHKIPVCYEMGEDTEGVARRLGISPDELSEFHSGATYTCYAVGFCPGFAYLGYLPKELQGVPRMASPRTRVEQGSVGMTGRQTAVYPLPRPGGWSLIGKTPLTLVDVAELYFPIEAGDTVEFHPIGLDDFNALRGERL
jgi:inhibitor of KinA